LGTHGKFTWVGESRNLNLVVDVHSVLFVHISYCKNAGGPCWTFYAM